MAALNKVQPGTQPMNPAHLPGGMASTTDENTYRPWTLTEQDVDSLNLDAIQTELAFRSTLSDVFTKNMDYVVKNTNSDEYSLPDSMLMKLNAPGGARTLRMPIADPIRGAMRAGDDEQSGHEVGQRMRYMLAYYNEESQAVATTTRGVEYNSIQEQFQLYNYVQPQLSKFVLETTGRQFREASLETFNTELIRDRGLAKHWQPNNFVANTDPLGQPVYDANLGTFTADIIDKLQAAATGTNGINANISIEFLDAVLHHAEVNLRIEHLMVGGMETYILVIPSSQEAKLSSLTGVLGEMWQRKSALTTEELTYPGVIGRYKKLLIISDSRYATVDADYAGGTLQTQYVEPGNEDNRNKAVYDLAASNTVWSIGGLYGKGAFLDWDIKSPYFKEEDAEYGKRKGVGVFRERGIQLALIRTDNAIDDGNGFQKPTFVENQSSIALWFTNTSVSPIVS